MMDTICSISSKSCIFMYSLKLAISLSIAVTLTCGNPLTLHLICNGPHSDLTYDDCQGAYHSNESACYFVENSGHYRPCASICNNVQIHTRAEDKCDSWCKGYKKSHCTPGVLSTVGTSDTITITTTQVTYSTSSKQKLSRTELGFAIGVPTGLVAALMIIIIIAVLRRKKTKKSFSSRTPKVTTQATSPTDNEHHSEDSIPLANGDGPTPATETNDPDPRAIPPYRRADMPYDADGGSSIDGEALPLQNEPENCQQNRPEQQDNRLLSSTPMQETDMQTSDVQHDDLGQRRPSQSSGISSDRGYNSGLASQNHSRTNSVGDLQSDAQPTGSEEGSSEIDTSSFSSENTRNTSQQTKYDERRVIMEVEAVVRREGDVYKAPQRTMDAINSVMAT